MKVQGLRGAAVAEHDRVESILSATRELLQALLTANPTLDPASIASAIFTTTSDLTAVYPARAARQLGWDHVPLLCTQEIPVPAGLQRCIRVLIHWNTDLPQGEIHHVYLRKASTLRPDIAPEQTQRSSQL